MTTILSPPLANRCLRYLLRASALLAALALGGIVAVLLWRTLPFLLAHGSGLFDSGWHPRAGEYGMAAMIAGSLLVSLLALALAAPVAVVLAAWLRFYAPAAIRRPTLMLVELMAGIPSVVYGLWGLLVLVPWINQWAPPGASWLAGSLVLALMVLPLALLVTDAALCQLPAAWWRAGDAMSLSRLGMLRRVLLPAAAPSILSGVVLQFGRALGETMAVLMVCGNVVQWPHSVFDPVRTLTANIALEMAYATGDHRVALFVSGLLLMAVTALLLVVAWRLRAANLGGHAHASA
ncbi:MAG: phosphate ABC transporter permease subunit PstC [Pseudomonadota bacterium]|uniref:phosphate ABC transporter permease subunit PstC n=1 Tax=Alloalcanivorax venustensis TaxID=172371 RepID=UPI002EBD48E4|nr:phosphate ABC transporter permease subunit PstC [Pseudomonadota bacterium]